MRTWTRLFAALVLSVAVLVIFAHPLLVGLPAPGIKYVSGLALLGSALVALLFSLAAGPGLRGTGPERAVPFATSERLALICTRLC